MKHFFENFSRNEISVNIDGNRRFICLSDDSCADRNANEVSSFGTNTIDDITVCFHLERLDFPDVYAFLRRLRRVLKPGGGLKIFYLSPPEKFFYDKQWTQFLGSLNPCKNISDNARRFDDFCFPRKHSNSQVPLFENYAFKQFFSRDRIIEIAKFSGLDFFVGEENILTDSDPDAAYFFEKFVKCVEFRKPRIEEIPIEPLVSICIPAHKSEFLRETLISIQGQDYENIEILVSDDSEDGQIFDIVDSFKDSRVRYLVPPIKEAHCNHIHPAKKSSGYFVKFCNDDDLLSRSAVSKLVGLASLNPAATLISSARRQIDRSGNLLPLSSGVFQPISKRPMLIDGQYASLLAIKFGNFIGEPNCTLFKKADFEIFGEQIFNICGDSSSLIFGTPADLQMWFNFLSRGDLVYTPEVLSYLRVHESAISFSHKSKPQEAKLGWKNFVDNATKYGFNIHSEPRFHEIA